MYLANKLPPIPLHRSHQLVALRPSLYGLFRNKGAHPRLLIPHDPSVITLIPRRDITKLRSTRKNHQQVSNRRYILVTYRPFKDAARRQKVSRLTIRLPAIRVKPGLLLLPQIKASRHQAYQSILLRPSEYVRELVKLGTTVWYASRLEAYTSEALIDQLLQEAFTTRSKQLVTTCKQLYKEVRASTAPQKTIIEVKERLIFIRFRLKLLRAQARFFANECGLDFQFAVSRAAAAVSRLRRYLDIRD